MKNPQSRVFIYGKGRHRIINNMALHQKGPSPADKVNANYPLAKAEGENQKETKGDKAFVLDDGSGKMPTITLETKQSGKIGSIPSVTVKPLREKLDDTFGPDQNFHDQFVKPDFIQPDERLR